MAKQAGILQIIGTLGGINFYFRKGAPKARTAGGGFNREAIKHSPTMKRVREQNTEFAHCSRVNKHFKQAINPLLSGYKDGTLHYRLMQLFTKIRDCDMVSAHGKRRVHLGLQTAIGKRLLLDFKFNTQRSNLFPCSYGFNWDALTFDVSGFKVSQVGFPKQADYMAISLGIVRFDFERLTSSDLNINSIVINKDFKDSDFNLDCPNLPNGHGIILVLARTAFYQRVGDQDYLLSGGSSFGLEVAGVSA